MLHTVFATTTQGLNRGLLPIRLYEKARCASLDEINLFARETEEA